MGACLIWGCLLALFPTMADYQTWDLSQNLRSSLGNVEETNLEFIMKYFICFILLAFSLSAGPKEDAEAALGAKYAALRAQGSVTQTDIEVLYSLWEAFLNILRSPTDEQITYMGMKIRELSRSNTDYEARYRAQREQRQRQRAISMLPTAPVVVDDPFTRDYGPDVRWDQVYTDYRMARGQAVLAHRALLQFLADNVARRGLANGAVLEPQGAANLLLPGLQAFFDRQLQRNAVREATDADQLRIFAIRLQVLRLFAQHYQLAEVNEQIAGLYRGTQNSVRVQEKVARADRACSQVPRMRSISRVPSASTRARSVARPETCIETLLGEILSGDILTAKQALRAPITRALGAFAQEHNLQIEIYVWGESGWKLIATVGEGTVVKVYLSGESGEYAICSVKKNNDRDPPPPGGGAAEGSSGVQNLGKAQSKTATTKSNTGTTEGAKGSRKRTREQAADPKYLQGAIFGVVCVLNLLKPC